MNIIKIGLNLLKFVQVFGLTIKGLQMLCKKNGIDPGPIDGKQGPKTEKAFLELIEKASDTGNVMTHLMIHCSATPPGMDVTPEMIRKWHIEGRGWSKAGYSTLIRRSGKTDILIPFDADNIIDPWEISNGASGWNGRAKHICYAGGVSENDINNAEDNRTEGQLAAMEMFVKMMIMFFPNIKLIGHNQVANKACPSFSVPEWAKSIGISQKNIDATDYNK